MEVEIVIDPVVAKLLALELLLKLLINHYLNKLRTEGRYLVFEIIFYYD